jgi:hypothetical protein
MRSKEEPMPVKKSDNGTVKSAPKEQPNDELPLDFPEADSEHEKQEPHVEKDEWREASQEQSEQHKEQEDKLREQIRQEAEETARLEKERGDELIRISEDEKTPFAPFPNTTEGQVGGYSEPEELHAPRPITDDQFIDRPSENVATSNDWQLAIQKQIQDAVAAHVASLGLDVSVGKPAVDFGTPPQAPPKFKKHYRNDVSPHVVIQKMDMSALDFGERPQAYPLAGQHIKFRFGHYYTSDDNEIAQLEWMMGRAATDAEGNTIGGNPAIYEDDGSVVYHCPQGCDYYTASKTAYEKHMKATHGVGA